MDGLLNATGGFARRFDRFVLEARCSVHAADSRDEGRRFMLLLYRNMAAYENVGLGLCSVFRGLSVFVYSKWMWFLLILPIQNIIELPLIIIESHGMHLK